jgi:hypothetical protein
MRRGFMLNLRRSRVIRNNDRNHASTGRAFPETPGGAPGTASIDCGGVLPPDSTRKLDLVPRIRRYLLVLFVFVIVVFLAGHFSESLLGTDFPDFYCAARMVAAGHGHQLYDADLQRQYQARYSGRAGTLYIHPPFEAIVYLAVAWLPLQRAYLLWSLLSLVFLAIGTRKLANEILPWHWEVLFAASLIFVPLLLCLQQGQDSLLLFLLVTLAFVALRRQRPVAAGCWLGLGLFKFQIVVPIVLVLLLSPSRNARSGLAKGFGLVALALVGLSAAISGMSVFIDYPQFLLLLPAQPFAGITPQAMANLRGLTHFFFRSDRSSWAIAVLTAFSVAALIATLNIWKRARFDLALNSSDPSRDTFDIAFANTVLFALLVSYHLNPHDLSLLLLPISLLLRYAFAPKSRPLRSRDFLTLILLGLLSLPPLHLWTLRAGAYAIVSLPALLLCLIGAENRFTTQATSPERATTVRD